MNNSTNATDNLTIYIVHGSGDGIYIWNICSSWHQITICHGIITDKRTYETKFVNLIRKELLQWNDLIEDTRQMFKQIDQI